jgi:hypothetical protein
MMRRLQHEVAARPVHPIEHDHVAHGVEAAEPGRPARIERDRALGIGFARVLRAIFAPFPRGANTSDIIKRGVEPLRQFDGDLALAQAVCAVVDFTHGRKFARARRRSQ